MLPCGIIYNVVRIVDPPSVSTNRLSSAYLFSAMTALLATTNKPNGIHKSKSSPQGSLYMLNMFTLFIVVSFLASPKVKRGLIPPVLDLSVHKTRCLAQLRSKDKSIEKYIYLSSLKEQDPNMFYKLCLEHMSEFTPLIYTPTVGDACQQYSHIYRHPEGLVRPVFFVSANFSVD